MGRIDILDLVFRIIPEGFIIILAGYAVSKNKLMPKKYILSSLILGIMTFLFKLLPITNILPMILSAITAVFIMYFINNIMPFKAIIATFICFVLSIIYEVINFIIFNNIFKVDKVIHESNKSLFGIPSLLLFATTIIILFIITRKKRNAVD